MINLSYIESLWAQELIGWLVLALSAAGLYFCVRYVRVSSSMPWLVLAFVGLLGTGLATRIFAYASRLNLIPDELANGLYVVTALIQSAAWASLVFGLGFVLRDVRERFHLLRDAEERSREDEWQKEDEAFRAGQRTTSRNPAP
ncbi:MAG: hypothetical protein EXS05_13050 [Planctomycetaceae bacterium]|nr:hypothetical protein [Planctomycetaceae bacterium]